jgi:3-hydroxymyristoyl/3-hydroxydecanoyl-(acyl carrier protein) dehydratase
MRFTFVDRIVAAEPQRRIEISTHVGGLDDVFADHFPGYPVLPGALVVEAFVQAAQLLIGLSHEFTRVGRLRGLSRVAFRHPVRPGDALAIRCERRADESAAWVIDATALVDGRRVASAALEFALAPAAPGTDDGAHAERLRALARELPRAPVAVASGERDE